MKKRLWKAIEDYRSSGSREEHWRNRDALDILIDEALTDNYRVAYDAWQDKTEWVQETSTPRELGKHRADVLRERIEALRIEVAQLAEFVIAVGGFWGHSKSKLIGEDSLAACINRVDDHNSMR